MLKTVFLSCFGLLINVFSVKCGVPLTRPTESSFTYTAEGESYHNPDEDQPRWRIGHKVGISLFVVVVITLGFVVYFLKKWRT